jgi:hypothetical protein
MVDSEESQLNLSHMAIKEPSQLRRGKAFHKLIQDEWLREAADNVVHDK